MKTMKKALAALFAVVFLFAAVIPAAALDGTISVTSIASARAGDEVEVIVSLQNNPGLYTAMIGIAYDAAALDLISVEDMGLFGTGEDAMTQSGNLDMIPFNVLWMNSAQAVTANGELLKIRFKVADDAQPGSYSFSVTCSAPNTIDAGLDAYDLGAASGSVTVIRMPGDADGNGEITMRDAVMIARFVAGGWNVQIDQSSADVNGDGSVDLMDVVMIKRFLVGGWNITLQ